MTRASRAARPSGPVASRAARPPGPIAVGEVVDVTIDRLAAGSGEGVGRHASGMTVFCAGAFPGERAAVLIERVQPRWARGSLFALEAPLPERTPPACAVADRCGGCTFHGVPYHRELAWKMDATFASMKRLAPDLAWPEPTLLGDASPDGYRERARLLLGDDGGSGFRAAQSHRVVESPSCPVLHPALDAVRHAVAACLEPGAGHGIVVEWDATRGAVALTLLLEGPIGPADRDALRALPGLSTLVLVTPDGGREVLLGEGRVRRVFGTTPVDVPTHRFAQANGRMLPRLVSAALDPLGDLNGRRVLELFAGSGTFTFPLAERGARVLAVDADGDAVLAASRAASTSPLAPRIAHEPIDLSDVRDLDWAPGPWDVLLVDPPRTGLPPALCDAIARAPARTVVYVSCDPATLARDLQRLRPERIESLHLVDMFPRTPHVEAVAHLTLRPRPLAPPPAAPSAPRRRR